MSFVLKADKLLEWCTELPKDCDQKTPVFLLKGVECFFRFALENQGGTWYYELFVELKSKLTEPEKFQLQVGFKKEQNLSLDKKEFSVSGVGAKEIWYIKPENILSKLPTDYMIDNCIKFQFSFVDVLERVLEDKKLKVKDVGNVSSDLHSAFCLESLSQDYNRLLNEGLNHDVEIKCGDLTWKAHKNILSVRSKVLQAMLHSYMIEGRTGVITLQDTDIQIVQLFLSYLYSGKLPEMTVETAKDLYAIGDKYAVECLKKSCAVYLENNLTPENACEFLLFANEHGDSSLKENVIDFMIVEKIFLNEDLWRDFRTQHSGLAVDVYDRFCKVKMHSIGEI